MATTVPARSKPAPLTYEEAMAVLDQEGRVRANDGWLVHCPVHDDSTPSLKIARSSSGALLLHCKAGCEFRDIVAALRERLDGMRVAPITPIPATPSYVADYTEVKVDNLKRRYASVWDWWVEKTGIPQQWWEANQVTVRNGNIAFSFGDVLGTEMWKIRNTDPGKGKYFWEPAGTPVKPPLWPPPHAGSPLGDIILTEGETDCATLRYLGYENAYAITTGCNSDTTKVLPGLKSYGLKSVTIVYDNDEPGIVEAGKQVAKLARFGIAAQQAILPLPFTAALQGVKDINDLWHWVGYDRERMLSLLETALQPPDTARQSWEAVTWEELMQADIKDAQWIIEGVIRQGWLVLLAGKGKQGKTTLAFHMMEALRTAGAFLGPVNHEVPVIYMNYEMHPSDIKQLLLDMRPARHGAKPLILTNPIVPLTAEGLRGFLRSQKQPGLVVVDCARAAFGLAQDQENDGAAVGAVLRPLARVARDTGWTILVIHHFNKREGDPLDVLNVAGTSEWINACDLIMTWSCPRLDEPGKLRLTGRIPSREDQVIELARDHVTFLGGEHDWVIDETRDVIEAVMPLDPAQAITASRILELCPSNVPTTKRRIDMLLGQMLEEGRVKRVGSGTKEAPYRYYWAEPNNVLAVRR